MGPHGKPEPPEGRGHGKMEEPGPPPPNRWPYTTQDAIETSDPEMFKLLEQDRKLGRQSQELAVQHQKASAQERGKIKERLEKLLNEHFDVRQQRRALELKRLDEELKRLHKAMDARAKARKTVIAKRLAELLGQEDEPHF
jgi:hypothetical protein